MSDANAPRILICVQAVDENDPWMGYFVTWLREASRAFPSITVLALRVGLFSLPPNVTVIPLRPSGSKSKLKAAATLLSVSWRERKNYDGVFVRGDAQYVLIAGWLWRLLRKRIVFWYAHYKTNGTAPWAARIAHVVTTSVPEAFLNSPVPVHPIGQAIPEEPFLSVAPLSDDAGLRVLVFGRVTEVKRVESIIDDFDAAELGNTASLTIVGTPRDEMYAIRIENLQDELANMSWERRDVPFAEVPDLFSKYDVIVNATPGSLDKVILEGMMAGRVVIAATEGVRDLLPQDLAWLHAPSSEARRDALRRLARMPLNERREIGERLRAIVRERHSLSRQVGKLAELFA